VLQETMSATVTASVAIRRKTNAASLGMLGYRPVVELSRHGAAAA
jgi:hypothetical protein